VSLSRDTTESDLKQRREISSGTAYYIDQSAVRAASHGRILVLEGIEKVFSPTPVSLFLMEDRVFVFVYIDMPRDRDAL
jgi:hypothetical protein